MTDDPVVVALEDVASTAVRRGHTDVYRFAMSAAGQLLTDPTRHRAMAASVLNTCRAHLAKETR